MFSAVEGNHYSGLNVITPDELPAQLITAGHESCPTNLLLPPSSEPVADLPEVQPDTHRKTKPSLSLQLAEIADGTEQVFPVLSGFHALKDVVATVRRRRATVAAVFVLTPCYH